MVTGQSDRPGGPWTPRTLHKHWGKGEARGRVPTRVELEGDTAGWVEESRRLFQSVGK